MMAGGKKKRKANGRSNAANQKKNAAAAAASAAAEAAAAEEAVAAGEGKKKHYTLEEHDDLLRKQKEYKKEHPKATLAEAAIAVGGPPDMHHRWGQDCSVCLDAIPKNMSTARCITKNCRCKVCIFCQYPSFVTDTLEKRERVQSTLGHELWFSCPCCRAGPVPLPIETKAFQNYISKSYTRYIDWQQTLVLETIADYGEARRGMTSIFDNPFIGRRQLTMDERTEAIKFGKFLDRNQFISPTSVTIIREFERMNLLPGTEGVPSLSGPDAAKLVTLETMFRNHLLTLNDAIKLGKGTPQVAQVWRANNVLRANLLGEHVEGSTTFRVHPGNVGAQANRDSTSRVREVIEILN